MIPPIRHFTGGLDSVRDKLNQIVDALNRLLNIRGDGNTIDVDYSDSGVLVKMSVPRLLPQIPKQTPGTVTITGGGTTSGSGTLSLLDGSGSATLSITGWSAGYMGNACSLSLTAGLWEITGSVQLRHTITDTFTRGTFIAGISTSEIPGIVSDNARVEIGPRCFADEVIGFVARLSLGTISINVTSSLVEYLNVYAYIPDNPGTIPLVMSGYLHARKVNW